MSSFITPFVTGIAVMAVLVAGVSYVNPAARCVSTNGTVWASAPISKCYPITAFVPANALEAAK